jgi:hypothetical protein
MQYRLRTLLILLAVLPPLLALAWIVWQLAVSYAEPFFVPQGIKHLS